MLLPIGDDNQGRGTTPYVNYLLIGLNVIAFIIQLLVEQDGGELADMSFAAIPYRITHGTLTSPPIPGTHGHGMIAAGPFPIYITLLTSMFMHSGFLHIGGNMLYLWIFGDNVEDNFGHVKYAIFYLLCGFAASFGQIALDPDSPIPSLGASGAIAGVLGAYLFMFPKNKVRTLVPLGFFLTILSLPAIVVIGLWFVLQVVDQYMSLTSASAKSGGVAYMAHISGFIAGIVLMFLFRRRVKDYPRYDDYA